MSGDLCWASSSTEIVDKLRVNQSSLRPPLSSQAFFTATTSSDCTTANDELSILHFNTMQRYEYIATNFHTVWARNFSYMQVVYKLNLQVVWVIYTTAVYQSDNRISFSCSINIYIYIYIYTPIIAIYDQQLLQTLSVTCHITHTNCVCSWHIAWITVSFEGQLHEETLHLKRNFYQLYG